ncbi:hypothetical protein [Acinetobacter sp. MD2(2019)]|uniref:hypothetical protein n=1 Tax=Acinetobacter sp. MD2(2019) TaxID=2605273 RepID=UPI002D1F0464|nr:hypothetical protein [Acinetobacter sp. MD2(2019)]MEB3755137.1 hypothetical protein [Acinetobacter sp. MD2(2019)]
MRKYLCCSLIALACLSTSNVAVANKGCGITRVSLNNLNLRYQSDNMAATSIEVECNRQFNIVFKARNLLNKNGDSNLINANGKKISTSMNISGATKSEWNTPLTPLDPYKQKFVVRVVVNERPNYIIPAGEYRDQLSVDVQF